MPDSQNARVAVYLDFDNIVISWYDRVHGRNSYGRDRQRIIESPYDPEIADRLSRATIDVGAIIDFAASFGTLVLTRAYADWSSPVNAIYRSQLVSRAVDLVQLFPAAAYAKNGADIRLAVDTVEDMFRLPDLTHVVIVAGDSDYVPLAQRCKRLGRYVIGVGVAGSTAKALAASCDEFESYDSLPGVKPIVRAPARDSNARDGGGRDSGSKDSGAKDAASKDAASKDASSKDAASKDAGDAPTRQPRGRGAAAKEAAAAKETAATEAAKGTDESVDSGVAEAPADAPAEAPKTRSSGGRRRSSSKDTAAATPSSAVADDASSGTSADVAGDAASESPAKAGTADAAASAAVEASLNGALDEAAPAKRVNRRVSSKTLAEAAAAEPAADHLVHEEPVEDPHEVATKLLDRALRLGHDKDDAQWLHTSAVKTHMRRMDPSFSEKALGYRSFSDFVKARESIAELEETGHERLVRLRE